MNQYDILFTLLNTTHPGNIGGAARAMKNMGFEQLALVNPIKHPSAEATARASGADDVLHRARVHADLDAAIADRSLVIGTSARRRDLDIPMLDARALAETVAGLPAHTPVALLFGQESWGLTNEEMLRCHYLLQLPANPAYSSLNLAAAVQVVAYELRMRLWVQAGHQTAGQPVATHVPVSQDKMASFFSHLEHTLQSLEYLNDNNRVSLMKKLHVMFNRMQPLKHEVDILRGILSRVNKYLD